MKKNILELPPGGLASVPKPDRPRAREGLMTSAGMDYTHIAAACKKSPQYIRYIINDERTGYKYRPVIARLIGFTVSDLWPDTPIQYR